MVMSMKKKRYSTDKISLMFNGITADDIRAESRKLPPPEKHWLRCRHLVLGGDFFPDMNYGKFSCELNHLIDPYAECDKCAFFLDICASTKYFQ